jgi:hypothetical protein
MRPTFYTKTFFAVILLVCINTASSQQGRVAVISREPLLGTWINTDGTTHGLKKLVISASSGGIAVQAFGACGGSLCDLGIVPGIAYGANVKANAAEALSAQYKKSWSTDTLVGRIKGQYLEMEVFTEFTDGSGRSNFHFTAQLMR